MSLAYHKMKMKVTHTAVEYTRNFCDGVNVVLGSVMLPFQKVGRRINAEAPWVIFAGACTLSMVLPLLAYPYVKSYITHDERGLREEERVRLCLQKGIDPYPYMQHKEAVYGNNIPMFGGEAEYPKEAAWEWDLMDKYEQRKEALRAEVDGSYDATVERLLQMRAQKKRDYESLKGKGMSEPADLIFKGRKDANQLNS